MIFHNVNYVPNHVGGYSKIIFQKLEFLFTTDANFKLINAKKPFPKELSKLSSLMKNQSSGKQFYI